MTILSVQKQFLSLTFLEVKHHWQMFFRVGILKNLTNFTGKHLRWRLILIKLKT